ncbi:MAG: alanine racemase, partial [Christensenellales bacterium]
MEILPFQKRTWVEVDIEAIRNNFRTIKTSVGDRKVRCVIKANAYGHGAVP